MSATYSDKSWNSSDEFEDDNSSTTTSSANRRISGDLDLPGGVITTHCVSSVIKHGRRSKSQDPLQFVKIQSTELSKKAVEQIRLAEEVKVTKEKIKEVEEEWQSNLLNWKSKRRQSKESAPNGSGGEGEDGDGSSNGGPRRIKTFSEILNEKAKSGHRIGYNLHRYVEGEEENEVRFDVTGDDSAEQQQLTHENSRERLYGGNESQPNGNQRNEEHAFAQRNSQKINGERSPQLIKDFVVVDTSLLKEFSAKHGRQAGSENHASSRLSQEVDKFAEDNCQQRKPDASANGNAPAPRKHAAHHLQNGGSSRVNNPPVGSSSTSRHGSEGNNRSNGSNEQQKNVWNYLLQQQQQDQPSSRLAAEVSDEEDEEEEDMHNESTESTDQVQQQQQLISFKAKLSAFENLAKPEVASHESGAAESYGSEPPLAKQPVGSSSRAPQQSSRSNGSSRTNLEQSGHSNLADGISNGVEPGQGHRASNGSAPSRPPAVKDLLQREKQVLQAAASQVQYSQGVQPQSHPQIQHHHQLSQSLDYEVDQITGRMARNALLAAQGSEQLNNYPSQQHVQPSLPIDQVYQPSSEYAPPVEPRFASQSHRSSQPFAHPEPQPYGTEYYYETSQAKPSYQGRQEPRAVEQLQYYMLDDDFGKVQQSSSTTQAIQEPLYSNNHQEQMQYIANVQQTTQQVTSSAHSGAPVSAASQHMMSANFNQNSQPMHQFNQHLYYPKPFSHSNKQPPQKPKHSAQLSQQATSTNSNGQQQPSQHSVYKPVPRPVPIIGSKQAAPSQQSSNYPSHPSQMKAPVGAGPAGDSATSQGTGYNKNHWLVQEAELRRQIAAQSQPVRSSAKPVQLAPAPPLHSEQIYENLTQSQNLAALQQKQSMLSVSGRKKCSSCGDELGRGCAAMVIESLSLYYHINCFRCSVCHIQLGNGTCGTDVRVRNHKLHCNNCYSNDEAGLKFSRV